MSEPSPKRPGNVTRLLNRAAAGDTEAARAIMPEVYRELRTLAATKQVSLAPGQSLRTTVLVHEAYIRILDREPDGWKERSHFFYAAARAMRDLLVEDARKSATPMHGGKLQRICLDDAGLLIDAPSEQVLALHECLEQLQDDDALGHQIVLYRFFVGLTMSEIAEISQVPVRSIERKWSFVRAWLATELAETHGGTPEPGQP